MISKINGSQYVKRCLEKDKRVMGAKDIAKDLMNNRGKLISTKTARRIIRSCPKNSQLKLKDYRVAGKLYGKYKPELVLTMIGYLKYVAFYCDYNKENKNQEEYRFYTRNDLIRLITKLKERCQKYKNRKFFILDIIGDLPDHLSNYINDKMQKYITLSKHTIRGAMYFKYQDIVDQYGINGRSHSKIIENLIKQKNRIEKPKIKQLIKSTGANSISKAMRLQRKQEDDMFKNIILKPKEKKLNNPILNRIIDWLISSWSAERKPSSKHNYSDTSYSNYNNYLLREFVKLFTELHGKYPKTVNHFTKYYRKKSNH